MKGNVRVLFLGCIMTGLFTGQLLAADGQAEISNPWTLPPVVQTSVNDGEFQIDVSLDPTMSADQNADVDSIRLENEAGELLGFKSREDKGAGFQAQFLIDLKNSMLDRVKVYVHGVQMGDWSSTISLVEARAALLSQESAPPAPAAAS